MKKGHLQKQENGRYCINERLELSCGDSVEVETPNGWVMMWVEHDGIDYYLENLKFSFYPKRVIARKS